jgi:formate--tetrahydrofolate ligase
VELCDQKSNFKFSYELTGGIKDKIEAVAKRIYHADGVDILPDAQKDINQLEKLGFGNIPVCMAKTQYSFTDDPTKLGAPKGWRLTVRKAKVSAGAGFIVALTGEIMTMPGLPPVPAAEKIDVDNTGKISGLF